MSSHRLQTIGLLAALAALGSLAYFLMGEAPVADSSEELSMAPPSAQPARGGAEADGLVPLPPVDEGPPPEAMPSSEPGTSIVVQAIDRDSEELQPIVAWEPQELGELTAGDLHLALSDLPLDLQLTAEGYEPAACRLELADVVDGVLRVPMTRGALLRGTVTNRYHAPLRGVQVDCIGEDGSLRAARSTYTSIDGSFELAGLGVGAFLRVEFRGRGYCTEVWQGTLRREQGPLTIVLVGGVRTSGKVVYASGAPVPDGAVRFEPLVPRGLEFVTTKIRPDGTFDVVGLREGEDYDLFVDRPKAMLPIYRQAYQASRDPLKIVVSGRRSPHGHVLGPDGLGLEGIDITLTVEGESVAITTSKVDGSFELAATHDAKRDPVIHASATPFDAYRTAAAVFSGDPLLLRLEPLAEGVGIAVTADPAIVRVAITALRPGLESRRRTKFWPMPEAALSIPIPPGDYRVTGLNADAALVVQREVRVTPGQWSQVSLEPQAPATLTLLHEPGAELSVVAIGGRSAGAAQLLKQSGQEASYRLLAPWSGFVSAGNAIFAVQVQAGESKTLDCTQGQPCEALLPSPTVHPTIHAVLFQSDRSSTGRPIGTSLSERFSFPAGQPDTPSLWLARTTAGQHVFTGSTADTPGASPKLQLARETLTLRNTSAAPVACRLTLLQAAGLRIHHQASPGYHLHFTTLQPRSHESLTNLPPGKYRLNITANGSSHSRLIELPASSEVTIP